MHYYLTFAGYYYKQEITRELNTSTVMYYTGYFIRVVSPIAIIIIFIQGITS